jgi:hypothetical protein
MENILYLIDKKHFGNVISVFRSTDWYFIIIKDRGVYNFSVMTFDKKKYYNVDSIIKKMEFEYNGEFEIEQNLDIDLDDVFFTEVPRSIFSLMQGNLTGKKAKERYKPRKSKFKMMYEQLSYSLNPVMREIYWDIISDRIEDNLLIKLPVFMKKRSYELSIKYPEIHFEGKFNDIWFQCLFKKEGILMLFDNFAPENKYSPDAYIPFEKFSNKEQLYEFIIEAFDYYFLRTVRKDFDTMADVEKYYNDNQKER